IESGVDVCIAVTLVDGLVLARSAFHHSINYRSVVVFGHAMPVNDFEEKAGALEAFVEHIIAGRWKDVRWPNEAEVKATHVLRLALVEASAKIRIGGPIDDEEDYNLSVWAGVVPLGLSVGEPIPDSRLQPGIEPPDYARNYTRRSRE